MITNPSLSICVNAFRRCRAPEGFEKDGPVLEPSITFPTLTGRVWRTGDESYQNVSLELNEAEEFAKLERIGVGAAAGRIWRFRIEGAVASIEQQDEGYDPRMWCRECGTEYKVGDWPRCHAVRFDPEYPELGKPFRPYVCGGLWALTPPVEVGAMMVGAYGPPDQQDLTDEQFENLELGVGLLFGPHMTRSCHKKPEKKYDRKYRTARGLKNAILRLLKSR